jgi:hypothetical protein
MAIRLGQQAVASVSPLNGPQTAVVGIVVGDRFEIVFDTVESSRKATNPQARSEVALVVGGLLVGEERRVPASGRGRAKRTRPTTIEEALLQIVSWRTRNATGGREFSTSAVVRFSDYNQDPPVIVEFDFEGRRGRG